MSVVTVAIISVPPVILPAASRVALRLADLTTALATFALILSTTVGPAQFPATLANLLSYFAAAARVVALSRSDAGN
jgi:hypothetical protein